MMTKLLESVRGLVADELAESRKNFEEYFHSPHEGYGVLAEELYEAECESTGIDWDGKTLIHMLHMNNFPSTVCALEGLQKSAVRAACEYIQVAAMAQKMRESIEVQQ